MNNAIAIITSKSEFSTGRAIMRPRLFADNKKGMDYLRDRLSKLGPDADPEGSLVKDSGRLIARLLFNRYGQLEVTPLF